MWKYFEFEVNGEWRLYRARLDNKDYHANPVAGLIAEYKHKKYGWQRVNNINKRELNYKELRQSIEHNTLNKAGVLGLIQEMMGGI